MLNQKGIIPVYIIVGILILGLVGGAVYFNQNSTQESSTIQKTNQEQATSSATPKSSASTNVTSSSSPKLTAKPVASATPKPSSTNSTSTTTKNTCAVNVIYGSIPETNPKDPSLVTLVASFNGYNGAYLAGAQWDFEGDGSWDTDLKQSNGTVTHNYGGGNHTVKLQVKGSDGAMTDVCNKSVSINASYNVSLNGQVYADTNCNNSKDDGEGGVANMSISIMEPTGLVHGTVTTDSSGNYSFQKTYMAGTTVTLEPATLDHKNNFPYPTATFSDVKTSATLNVSSCINN